MVPVYWDKIKEQTKTTTKKTGFLVLLTKVLAGVAAFLLLKATDLGEVSVVQALDAVRFFFILFISVVFSHWLPHAATDRDTRPQVFFRRLIFIVIIIVGYFLLFT